MTQEETHPINVHKTIVHRYNKKSRTSQYTKITACTHIKAIYLIILDINDLLKEMIEDADPALKSSQ